TDQGRAQLLAHAQAELEEWNAFTRKTTRQSLEKVA
ncbi:MAG: pentapeptide repeat-containing protein, partial [Phormidesmis priestleyi]